MLPPEIEILFATYSEDDICVLVRRLENETENPKIEISMDSSYGNRPFKRRWQVDTLNCCACTIDFWRFTSMEILEEHPVLLWY